MSAGPRLRFAPSPTGYLHIGGARTALFNWLLARRHGGTFILRVEDTDQKRSDDASLQAILDGLTWLGLDWDEGPYFQMERLDVYREHTDRLLAEGKAYRCYCTKEELAALRTAAEKEKRAFRYPGTCRERTDTPDGEFVVRLKMPTTGTTTFTDLVRGEITTPHEGLQDEVIVRRDGVPLYNYGVVVDDATMGITLVSRGDDHINNTVRQLLIYEALGFEPPSFAHLPMILGHDQKRMSKRHGAVSVTWYRDEGYLPEAMLNYLVRLGWSFDDKTEIFDLEFLLENFDLERVVKSPAVFDEKKLQWLNQHWMQEAGPQRIAEELVPRLAALGVETEADDRLRKLVEQIVPRTKTLRQAAEMARVFYTRGVPEFQEKAVRKFLVEHSRPHLEAVHEKLQSMESVDEAALEEWLREYAESQELKLGKVAQPLRVALVGGTASPGIFETLALIGRDESLLRIDEALAKIK